MRKHWTEQIPNWLIAGIVVTLSLSIAALAFSVAVAVIDAATGGRDLDTPHIVRVDGCEYVEYSDTWRELVELVHHGACDNPEHKIPTEDGR